MVFDGTLFDYIFYIFFFFFSSRRRHTRFDCDWSSDVCSSDLASALNTAVAPKANPAYSFTGSPGAESRSTNSGRIGKTIAELSWISSKVTISGIRLRELRPRRRVVKKPGRAAVDGGAKCS